MYCLEAACVIMEHNVFAFRMFCAQTVIWTEAENGVKPVKTPENKKTPPLSTDPIEPPCKPTETMELVPPAPWYLSKAAVCWLILAGYSLTVDSQGYNR